MHSTLQLLNWSNSELNVYPVIRTIYTQPHQPPDEKAEKCEIILLQFYLFIVVYLSWQLEHAVGRSLGRYFVLLLLDSYLWFKCVNSWVFAVIIPKSSFLLKMD